MKNNNGLFFGVGLSVGLLLIIGTIYVVRKKNASKKFKLKKVDFSKFDSPDQKGSGKCMDEEFVLMLLEVEEKTGYPIIDEWINSGVRSEEHNTKVGGVKSSAHTIPICRGVDIKTKTKEIRENIVKAAVEVGFVRIGIGNTFVHLDNDPTKPQNVAWGYPSPPPYNPYTRFN